MKRSDVNEVIREAETFIASLGFQLPPFAFWSPDSFRANARAAMIDRGLGWDVTDYGGGNFADLGLLLFTLRNGSKSDLSTGRGMLYAEKNLVCQPQQLAPMHRHIVKAEDIINRGGGTLVLEFFAADKDGKIDRHTPFVVPVDGVERSLSPGGRIAITPGSSVTILPGMWHAFWAEKAPVLAGEVSTVNDDRTDNVFEDPIPRFTTVDENETPYRLLVSDYDEATALNLGSNRDA